jgi:hypothetical protein
MKLREDDSEAKGPTKHPSEELASALRLLTSMIKAPQQQTLLDPHQRTTSKMVYTHGVTLWMLVLQRLGGGQSLVDVVSQILTHDRDLLPDNKRVRENTLSENSGGYSRARKRLPLETILEFSQRVCDYLAAISQPLIQGRRTFLLDGTTITLAPTPELQAAYPPAENQHGTSVWPVAQFMVAAELQSGCVLLPQIDPMYGPNNASLPCPSALAAYFTSLSTGSPAAAYLVIAIFAAGIACSLSVVGFALQQFGDRLSKRLRKGSSLPWAYVRASIILGVGVFYTFRLLSDGVVH